MRTVIPRLVTDRLIEPLRARAVVAAIAASVLLAHVEAVTRVPSADGQFWDIQDTSPWAQDSGGIATGGRANPFNGFGYLKLQVRRADRTLIVRDRYLRGFGLAYDGVARFDSITPLLAGDVVIARGITARRDAAYLRYFDSFTNTSTEERVIEVAWGGASGAYEDGGRAAVAMTSNGDRQIDLTDTFVTMMQNARSVADPSRGPSGHGPSAHVLGSNAGLLTAVGDMYGDPFADKWPGFDPAHVGYVFTLRLAPGQTAALITFVVKGLSEVYDPRGGYPIAIKDGLVGGEAPYSGADARIPAAGSEIARVSDVARQLVKEPDLRGLTPRQLSQIANWPAPLLENVASFGTSVRPRPRHGSRFSVFEKTVTNCRTR